MIDFTNQIAVVTGGASGIGFAIAQMLSENNAHVVIVDVNEELAKKAASTLDGDAIAISADVAVEDSVEAMTHKAWAWQNQIDILVHSAGVGLEKSFLQTSLEEWRRVIDIDLTGAFLCGKSIAQMMATRKYGRIVNIASTAGLRGGTGRAAYGAAKGGVITLTKVMAVELAKQGITVNALAPGAIETALVAKMHSDETRRVYKRAIPMDRYGSPIETASAACFLASKQAGYITGEIMGVDGGFLAAGVLHER